MTTVELNRITTRPQLEHVVRMAEDELAALRQHAAGLEARLADTRRIGEAIGVIMAEYKLSDLAAECIFAELVATDGKSPRAVADRILATHGLQ